MSRVAPAIAAIVALNQKRIGGGNCLETLLARKQKDILRAIGVPSSSARTLRTVAPRQCTPEFLCKLTEAISDEPARKRLARLRSYGISEEIVAVLLDRDIRSVSMGFLQELASTSDSTQRQDAVRALKYHVALCRAFGKERRHYTSLWRSRTMKSGRTWLCLDGIPGQLEFLMSRRNPEQKKVQICTVYPTWMKNLYRNSVVTLINAWDWIRPRPSGFLRRIPSAAAGVYFL